jgi:hypothetical protein
VGEQLRNEGWRGLVAPSAARPTSRVLAVCLFPTIADYELVRATARTDEDGELADLVLGVLDSKPVLEAYCRLRAGAWTGARRLTAGNGVLPGRLTSTDAGEEAGCAG